jgi:hypothetical protein
LIREEDVGVVQFPIFLLLIVFFGRRKPEIQRLSERKCLIFASACCDQIFGQAFWATAHLRIPL